MQKARWIIPVLYGLLFAGGVVGGFVYTYRYSGWGHHPSNAVPVGLGVGAMLAFVAAIAVSQMNPRQTLWTLGVMTGLCCLGAAGIWWAAP